MAFRRKKIQGAIKSGWLAVKAPDADENFTDLYAVLRGDSLDFYYNAKEAERDPESIQSHLLLENCIIIQSVRRGPIKHGFTLLLIPEGLYVLAASTEEEKKSWIKAIRKTIGNQGANIAGIDQIETNSERTLRRSSLDIRQLSVNDEEGSTIFLANSSDTKNDKTPSVPSRIMPNGQTCSVEDLRSFERGGLYRSSRRSIVALKDKRTKINRPSTPSLVNNQVDDVPDDMSVSDTVSIVSSSFTRNQPYRPISDAINRQNKRLDGVGDGVFQLGTLTESTNSTTLSRHDYGTVKAAEFTSHNGSVEDTLKVCDSRTFKRPPLANAFGERIFGSENDDYDRCVSEARSAPSYAGSSPGQLLEERRPNLSRSAAAVQKPKVDEAVIRLQDGSLRGPRTATELYSVSKVASAPQRIGQTDTVTFRNAGTKPIIEPDMFKQPTVTLRRDPDGTLRRKSSRSPQFQRLISLRRSNRSAGGEKILVNPDPELQVNKTQTEESIINENQRLKERIRVLTTANYELEAKITYYDRKMIELESAAHRKMGERNARARKAKHVHQGEPNHMGPDEPREIAIPSHPRSRSLERADDLQMDRIESWFALNESLGHAGTEPEAVGQRRRRIPGTRRKTSFGIDQRHSNPEQIKAFMAEQGGQSNEVLSKDFGIANKPASVTGANAQSEASSAASKCGSVATFPNFMIPEPMDPKYSSSMWCRLVDLWSNLLNEERNFWKQQLQHIFLQSVQRHFEANPQDIFELLDQTNKKNTAQIVALWKQIYESWIPRDYLDYCLSETRKVLVCLHAAIGNLFDIIDEYHKAGRNTNPDVDRRVSDLKNQLVGLGLQELEPTIHVGVINKWQERQQSVDLWQQSKQVLKNSHAQLLEQVYSVAELVGAALDADMEDTMTANQNSQNPLQPLNSLPSCGLQVAAKLQALVLDLESRLEAVTQPEADGLVRSNSTLRELGDSCLDGINYLPDGDLTAEDGYRNRACAPNDPAYTVVSVHPMSAAGQEKDPLLWVLRDNREAEEYIRGAERTGGDR
ncbi:unnamed protein product [Calicophoron daubneyi]|uniref:PH domain-containing protein n=1 Tax=Calicophoron daubneyi TaxID=300641 RepID=A0AAV2TVT4_CALDB